MNLPQQLIDSLKPLSGFNAKAFIEAHQKENKITSVRLNPFKKTELDFELNDSVDWCSNAFYLKDRPSFTMDPLFHAGCYYVQEAGSMFLEHALKSILDFSQPLKVLDVCAAPGGKSTLINSLLNNQSLLIANEVVKTRAAILSQNLSKWGTSNTIVTNNDPQKFSELNSYFDAVIIDAPCSGSGLFRKQPEAISEWSLNNVNLCSARQKRILASVIDSLKETGILIYSTCSYSTEENEAVINWLLTDFDMEYIPLPIKKEWGIIETSLGYRFYPHLTQSEGFFCAVLKKKNTSGIIVKSIKNQNSSVSKNELEILSEFVNITEDYFFKNNKQFHLLNSAAFQFITQFTKNFYYKKAGIAIGEIKGKDMIPNQELAWGKALNALKIINLDKIESLKFLKKQAFTTAEFNPGFSLISYKNQGLGWAKTLPGRINNYLPSELRILS